MGKSDWDFSKLPESKYNYAIKCLEERNIPRLLRLHNTYELSKYNYCCGGVDKAMLNWFDWGVTTGKIKKI